MLPPDPIRFLQGQLREYLARGSTADAEFDTHLADGAGWRPHVLERKRARAWYVLVQQPTSPAWAEWIARARDLVSGLKIAVAVDAELLASESLIETIDSLDAEILTFSESAGRVQFADEVHAWAGEYVWKNELQLPAECAARLLDRAYQRAVEEPNSYWKGIRLEETVALLLSQVVGYRVRRHRLRGHGEEFDLLIENKNRGGALGRGSFVLVECKNTGDRAERDEASDFTDMLRQRHGFVRMGYVVSMAGFTSGFLERIRKNGEVEVLVVPIDGDRLPRIWRSSRGITHEVSEQVMEAMAGVF